MRLAESDDLLRTARSLLIEELLPQLPESHRYRALMLANSLSIAQRQSTAAADEEGLLQQALQRLYPEGQDEDLYPRLQQELRSSAGPWAVGGPQYQVLWQSLRQLTLANLAVSNPKVLKQRG
ncbi:MAG: DUF6285 domain-containing protein [Pseudomonas sp.]